MLIDALKDLCAEKEISQDTLFDAIESALIFACKKTANSDKRVIVDLNRDKGEFHVYEIYDIVEDVLNKNREISLADAKKADEKYELGDVFRKEVSPNNFGRIAAQAAKQFVMQKIREAERGVVYDEFTNRDNDVVTGTVSKIEDGNVIVDIGKTEAILVPVEQIYTDRFKVGDRVRAYVAEVRKIGKGPQVYLSRTHPGLLRRLFELEVPEIQEGIVSIKAVARESGNRSKVAVTSNDPNVEPVGACLGERGVRAQAISQELRGEKIDVVKWDADPAIFIANALSPSKVMRVAVNEYEKVSHVVVPNNQLSLAIGKEGQNARLAAKITGWKIDIKSKAQAKDETYDEDTRVVQLIEERPRKKKVPKIQQPQPPKDLSEQGQEQQPKKKKKKKKKSPQEQPQVQAPPPPQVQAQPQVPVDLFGAFDAFEPAEFGDEFSAPDFGESPAPAAEETPAAVAETAPDAFSTPDFGDSFEQVDFGDAFGDSGFDEPAETEAPAAETEAPVEEPAPPAAKKSAKVTNLFAQAETEPEPETKAEPEPEPETPAAETPAEEDDPFGAFDAFADFDDDNKQN
ncbi:MAG: transcription termination/antitermination protein NusA [Selenomonadaceae bacterium]|nr:transcription termination/antitermination protein NusA [Selenomonadaceae bacterium]